jgi:hypothetical protein
MTAKANQKATEGVTISGAREPDVGRRNIGAMLLAAIGVAGAAGCISATGEGPERVGEIAAAIPGVTIGWVDTVLGAPPSSTRTGDLALYRGGSSDVHCAVVVVAKGCVTKGDGGGGLFYWDEADSSSADDGGTVIVPMSGTDGGTDCGDAGVGGCWKRIYSGALNLAWFGASPTGTGLDNTIALFKALQVVVAASGALEVSHLYPIGHANWGGISIGPTVDSSPYRITAAAQNVTIEGTMAGAGFTFMNVTADSSGILNIALKFDQSVRLTLRNLTLDGSRNDPLSASPPLAMGFLYLQKCKDTVVEGCSFTNCVHTPTRTLNSISGIGNRFENNLFSKHGGIQVGYVGSGQSEEGAQILGNTILAGYGADDNTAGHTSMYTTIRNGVIANNSFRDMTHSVALIVMYDIYQSDVTSNVSIVGNTFYNCRAGIRQDLGVGGVHVFPMQNISIAGNVFELGGDASSNAISLVPTTGLAITGNTIRNYDGVAVSINGCSDVVVSGNVIRWDLTEVTGTARAIVWSTNVSDVKHAIIDGNSIIGYANCILAGTAPMALVTCSDLAISNNYFYCDSTAMLLGIEAIYINANTDRVRIFNNRIETTGTIARMRLDSTCQLINNQFLPHTSPNFVGSNTKYYWEEESGRKTYRPDTSVPTTPPAGVTWGVGDLQYNSSAALSVGDPVGWIYMGTTLGWRGFGVIV